MRWRTLILRTLALLTLVPLACSSAESTPPGTTTPPPGSGAASVPPVLMGAQAKAASAAYAAQLDVVKIASQGFTLDLTKALPPLETSGPQADALARAVRAQAAWLAAASALGGASAAGASTTLSVRTRSTSRTGSVKSAIIGIDDALIIAGLALVAYSAAKGVQKAVEIRTEPASEKIATATAGELKVINTTLGLPATTTQADAKKAFDDLPMGQRLARARDVEQDLRVAVTNNAPGVNDIAAEKIQRSVAESTVQCGKTGLNATVGASTFTGQGYSQFAQALGAGAKTGAVIDFTISAVGAVTDTPVQPLDVFSARLEGTAASQQKSSVVVPAVPAGMTLDSANTVLASSEPKLSEFAAAIDAKIRFVIDSLSSVLGAITKSDGTLVVDAPDQVHQLVVDDAKNVQTVQMRDLGPAKLVLATDCYGAQLFTVDTSAPANVDYSTAQDACSKGDCSAVLQYVDPYISLPAECEKCINSTCAPQCAACDTTCLQTVDACFTRCDDVHATCKQSCSGEGLSQCLADCSGADIACGNACDALPETKRTTPIGECIQGPCGTACASVIK
jgi:hypothetical protein